MSLKFGVQVKTNKKTNKVLGEAVINDSSYYVIELSALPAQGNANKELIKFLSKILQISSKDISLKSGTRSKFKIIEAKNIDLSYLNSKFLTYINT